MTSSQTWTTEEESPRILVVEDDVRLSSMLRELLSAEGYQVVLAADGQRALHEGLTQPFDVILLDRGLRLLEGVEPDGCDTLQDRDETDDPCGTSVRAGGPIRRIDHVLR